MEDQMGGRMGGGTRQWVGIGEKSGDGSEKKTHEHCSECEFSTHGLGSVNSVMVVHYSY